MKVLMLGLLLFGLAVWLFMGPRLAKSKAKELAEPQDNRGAQVAPLSADDANIWESLLGEDVEPNSATTEPQAFGPLPIDEPEMVSPEPAMIAANLEEPLTPERVFELVKVRPRALAAPDISPEVAEERRQQFGDSAVQLYNRSEQMLDEMLKKRPRR